MGKKPIVSLTYENERISITNSLPYLKCVLRLSCVVHGPIYDRFIRCTINGFLSLQRLTVYSTTHETAINRPMDHTGETYIFVVKIKLTIKRVQIRGKLLHDALRLT